MKEILIFISKHHEYFESIARCVMIVLAVVTGFMCRIFWDKSVRITAGQFFTGVVFITAILFQAENFINYKFVNFSALLFGFGTSDLIKKWIKLKVWNKYDFVSKGKSDFFKKPDKKDDDKDDKNK